MQVSEVTHPAVGAMVSLWRAQNPTELESVKFAADSRANRLVKEDCVAFLMVASIDRGGNSYQLWNVPYLLREKWGHLNTAKIASLDPTDLATDPIVLGVPSQISRLQLAKTIVSVAQVVEKHGGDAARLFEGTSDEVIARLQEIFGVGEGIARMTFIQRRLFFGLQPAPGGRLLPKLDVHLQRVLTRTGVVPECTDEWVEAALLACSHEEIAVVDQVAWGIGRNNCHPTAPKCGICPLRPTCEQRGIPA